MYRPLSNLSGSGAPDSPVKLCYWQKPIRTAAWLSWEQYVVLQSFSHFAMRLIFCQISMKTLTCHLLCNQRQGVPYHFKLPKLGRFICRRLGPNSISPKLLRSDRIRIHKNSAQYQVPGSKISSSHETSRLKCTLVPILGAYLQINPTKINVLHINRKSLMSDINKLP